MNLSNLNQSIRYISGALFLFLTCYCVETASVKAQGLISTPPIILPEKVNDANKQIESRAIAIITPISAPAANLPALPVIGNMAPVKVASTSLVIVLDSLLVRNGSRLTLGKVNNALAAYNNLIAVMELTDARQLEYYPRLKKIAISLVSLKTSLTKQ